MIDTTKIKVGNSVTDRWYPGWGIGKITEILSPNRIKIYFKTLDDTLTYDKSHCQFLEPYRVKKGAKKCANRTKRKG